MLKDCYEVCEHNGEKLKVFKSHFTPPEQSDKCWTIMFDACSTVLSPTSEDVLQLPVQLKDSLVAAINTRVAKHRQQPIRLLKGLILLSIGGALLLSTLAIVLAFAFSLLVSICLASFYFVALFLMITFHSKRSKLYEKKYIFNLGLVIANLNSNKGEVLEDMCLI